MKFDNEAGKNVKAFGSLLKETAKTAVKKIKIRQAQGQVRSMRRMNSGGRNTAKNSMGLAKGVSRKRKN